MPSARAVRALSYVVLLAAFAPGVSRAAIPTEVSAGAWCEVRSPHVRVLTDASPARADRIAERVERLHEQLAHLSPTLANVPATTDVVFLFRTGEAFRAYLPLYQGRPEEDSGLFQAGPAGGAVLLADGPDAELDMVALHESTHAMLHAAISRPPLWLDEGLAQYLSTLRVDDADARVGEPMPGLVAWLRSHPLIPLEELLAMDGTSPDYHAGERRQTFYAESWLLVHLLLTGEYADQARFDQYLAALRGGQSPGAAFHDAFGAPEHVQARLGLYLDRPSLGAMEWSFPVAYSQMSIERREHVPAASVLAALGEMLRWRAQNGIPAAWEHAHAALALDPEDPDAQALERALTTSASAPAADDVPGGEDDFAREQQAIAAYNNGVGAFNRGDFADARLQFRLAARLARKPDLVAKIASAQALARNSGAEPRIDQLHRLLQSGNRWQARQLVREMLAGDLDPVLRGSLTRMQAALEWH